MIMLDVLRYFTTMTSTLHVSTPFSIF